MQCNVQLSKFKKSANGRANPWRTLWLTLHKARQMRVLQARSFGCQLLLLILITSFGVSAHAQPQIVHVEATVHMCGGHVLQLSDKTSENDGHDPLVRPTNTASVTGFDPLPVKRAQQPLESDRQYRPTPRQATQQPAQPRKPGSSTASASTPAYSKPAASGPALRKRR